MRLYESLYMFFRYTQDIRYIMEVMIDLGYRERKATEWNLKDQAHYIALYNTIIMNTCSFLEEYSIFFTKSEPEFHERIVQVRKIAKPALKKINEWTDLRKYRNDMIAHNFRVAGDQFSFNFLGQYNAPRTYRDLAMLRKHLVMINTIVEAEFEKESKHVNTFLDSFPVRPQEISYDNIEQELTNVVNEINQLCIDNDKGYRLKLDFFWTL